MNDNPNIIARNPDGTPLQSARVSVGNTSATPPTMAAPFVGDPEYIIDFVGITLNLATAQVLPHAGTLYFEFSPDSVHWDISVPIRYTSANAFVPYPLRKVLPWFRLRYVPLDDNATEFRLTTIYHRLAPETLTRILDQDILLSEPVKVVRAGLMAENLANTRMENLQRSAAGLLIDSTRLSLEQTQQDVLAAIRALDSGMYAAPFTGINGDVVSLVSAMPVAQPTTTLLRATNASGFALANVCGLVVVGNDVTMPVRVLAQGVLTLPTSIWDVVTGGLGGLIPGAYYYLDAALGTLTTTPPVTPGLYLSVIGSAVSAVTFLVDPEPPILL